MKDFRCGAGLDNVEVGLGARKSGDQGFTAILVTHDVSEAVALADRVLVIENGQIAHDIDVTMHRPRQRGSAELARFEGTILRELLKGGEEQVE